MSIATLKRKTEAKYNNMSVGSNGFSLNGTHRSQGWVGQSMLSRSLPRTPMKGNTPKGNGGCCGTYNKAPGIIQSAVTSLNNNNVVKPTSLTTKGMLEERLTPYHDYLTVKPDATQNSNNIQEYTENLAKVNISVVDSAACTSTVKFSNKPSYSIYYRRNLCNGLTYPLSKYSPIMTSDQLANKQGATLNCSGNNKPTVQKATNGGVLPGPAASY
jgi:hypothetical protein